MKKDLFRIIYLIVCSLIMFITTAYALYQKMYWECIITTGLTLFYGTKIPKYVKDYNSKYKS